MTAVMTLVLTAGFVADAVGGRLTGDPARVFADVATDSRVLSQSPGIAQTLFIALKGPNFDGHAFVPDLVGKGVGGVLVADGGPARADGRDQAVVIRVDDTLAALQRLAHRVRQESGARVVAITGSAGKTTTKEMTAALLATRYAVFRNQGNLNNHIGLPLSLLELRHGAEIAVVELGMNHAGEIRALVSIAQPDVRIWTNVGDAHIGHFGSREAIADAKAEILEQATAATLLVANADDPLVVERIRRFGGRTISFGERNAADVRADNIQDHGFDGTAFDVAIAGRRFGVRVPLPGRANLMNALAAIAVAADCGVSDEAIAATLPTLRAVSRRGEVTVLASGARLVDDSYNASPDAMKRSLQALAATPVSDGGRRVAVLGEMRELGDLSAALHRDCGTAAATAGVDLLVTVGGADAAALADGAVTAGLAAARVLRAADSSAAAALVPGLIHPGDIVLVKASRGSRADVIADRLKGRS